MSKPIKLLSLFSGIGAFEKALTRLNIPYEVVNYSEIDKYASKAYSLIHNISEDKNLGDITKINEKCLPELDLVTYGFPCQDLSFAGRQKGLVDENSNKTRSGLLFDALRIIKNKKPKYAIAENVKGLVSKKFKKDFEWLLHELDYYGYNNYWRILNAKDFGIPQNRERVFIISIRKDIDKIFEFPKGFQLNIKLKDILEENIDEKYYVNSKIKIFKYNNKYNINTGNYSNNIFINSDLACTLDANYYRGLGCHQNRVAVVQFLNGNLKIKKDELISCIDANYSKGLDNHASRSGIIEIGLLDIKGNEQVKRVYDPDGISPTLNSMTGGNRQPKILLNYKIRKLTPLECWRLMGFDDEDFYKAKNGLNKYFYNGKDKSDSQLYKMAGNSIVVNVLEHIFYNLFCR